MCFMEIKNHDILYLPCPTSERHPRMTRADRAAQFAPYSALVGYESAIAEAARLTMRDKELGEDATERLDRWQRVLAAIVDSAPRLRICYFLPDEKKRGGRYITEETSLIGFSQLDKTITLSGGVKIPIENIKSIESQLFSAMLEGED